LRPWWPSRHRSVHQHKGLIMATKGVNPFAKMPVGKTTKAPAAAGPKAAAGNPFAKKAAGAGAPAFKAGGKAKC
jgi:hypothetical protein